MYTEWQSEKLLFGTGWILEKVWLCFEPSNSLLRALNYKIIQIFTASEVKPQLRLLYV